MLAGTGLDQHALAVGDRGLVGRTVVAVAGAVVDTTVVVGAAVVFETMVVVVVGFEQTPVRSRSAW